MAVTASGLSSWSYLKEAVRAGRLASNPTADVRLPKNMRREVCFLDPTEVARLTSSMDPRFSAIVNLGAYSGLRIGEMLGLRVGRVDVLGGLASLAKATTVSAMTTMNVSLPDELRSFVDAQVNEGKYGSTSEYVRELIRRDHDRRHLRAALLEGARAPITANADASYFASLRDRARAHG